MGRGRYSTKQRFVRNKPWGKIWQIFYGNFSNKSEKFSPRISSLLSKIPESESSIFYRWFLIKACISRYIKQLFSIWSVCLNILILLAVIVSLSQRPISYENEICISSLKWQTTLFYSYEIAKSSPAFKISRHFVHLIMPGDNYF